MNKNQIANILRRHARRFWNQKGKYEREMLAQNFHNLPIIRHPSDGSKWKLFTYSSDDINSRITAELYGFQLRDMFQKEILVVPATKLHCYRWVYFMKE